MSNSICFPILDGERGLRRGERIRSSVATGAITLKYLKSSGTPLFKYQKEVNASPFSFFLDRNWPLSQCRPGIIDLAFFLKGSKAANIWVWWCLCELLHGRIEGVKRPTCLYPANPREGSKKEFPVLIYQNLAVALNFMELY